MTLSIPIGKLIREDLASISWVQPTYLTLPLILQMHFFSFPNMAPCEREINRLSKSIRFFFQEAMLQQRNKCAITNDFTFCVMCARTV